MSAAGSYQLGVDLGTTWTAAAIARDDRCAMVGLGNRSAAVPSVVYRAEDGAILTGDAADRRGPSEPLRVAREFKRRVGDPTPILLGGTPYSAEALLGTLLDAVVARVAELEGGPPSHLTVTHPANWRQYRTELFDQAVQLSGVAVPTSLLTEPEAAAVAYATNARVEPGALVAVYDLGGGTFDTAILRKTADGFAILGRPAGIERLGGIDFDEAVVGHVRTALGGELDRLDPGDPATLQGLTRLRRECVEAKEALSADTEVTIPVLLPGIQTEVRLTRDEFEAMIRPTLHATTDALERALRAAAVEAEQISTVLLVGGSSRIPLVAELVSRAFGRPVAVDAHPKHAIALGAARAAALAAGGQAGSGDAHVLPFAAAPPLRTAAGPAGVSARDVGAGVAGRDGHAAAIDDLAETTELSAVIAATIAGRDQPSALDVEPPAAASRHAPHGDRATDPPRRRATQRALHDVGLVAPGAAAQGGVAGRQWDVAGQEGAPGQGGEAGQGGGAGHAQTRPRVAWDQGRYDDVPDPDEVPEWLAAAREEAQPGRRRWMVALMALVVLSVLAVGAGAFVASEPRAEAFDGGTFGLPSVGDGGTALPVVDRAQDDHGAADGDADAVDADAGDATAQEPAPGSAPADDADENVADATRPGAQEQEAAAQGGGAPVGGAPSGTATPGGSGPGTAGSGRPASPSPAPGTPSPTPVDPTPDPAPTPSTGPGGGPSDPPTGGGTPSEPTSGDDAGGSGGGDAGDSGGGGGGDTSDADSGGAGGTAGGAAGGASEPSTTTMPAST